MSGARPTHRGPGAPAWPNSEAPVRDLNARLGANATNSGTAALRQPARRPQARHQAAHRQEAGRPARTPAPAASDGCRRSGSIEVIAVRPHATATAARSRCRRYPAPDDPEADLASGRGVAQAGGARSPNTRGTPAPAPVAVHSTGALTARGSQGPQRWAATDRHAVLLLRLPWPEQCSVEEIADAVFDAPTSLGTVPATWSMRSQRRPGGGPPGGGRAAVRQAAVKSAGPDQLETRREAVLVVGGGHCHRGRLRDPRPPHAAGPLTAILGLEILGILCSDRWCNRVPPLASPRQICWAHLNTGLPEDRGPRWPGSGGVGRAGAATGQKGLRRVARVPGGEGHAGTTENATGPSGMNRMNRALLEALFSLGARRAVIAVLRERAGVGNSLWTFVTTEGVEPTNNHAERILRTGVLWRKARLVARAKQAVDSLNES